MLVTQHRVRTKHCMYDCFVLKRKVLRFRDVDIYFFLAKVGRPNTMTFSDCKLLLLLYILNLTLLSMCI